MALPEKAVEQAEAVFKGLIGENSSFADRFRAMMALSSWVPREEKKHAPCHDSVQYIANLRHIGLPAGAVNAVIVTPAPAGGRTVEKACFEITGEDTLSLRMPAASLIHRNLADATHRMPLALVIGAPEAVETAAGCSIEEVSERIDRYLLAGLTGGKRISVTDCLTQELRVPADCSIVIEGYVQKSEAASGSEEVLPVHVSCITHRH